MRLSAEKKTEALRLVESSDFSVRQTCAELGVHRSAFYRWCRANTEHGYEGLVAKKPDARRQWNRIPESVREQVLDAALASPELSPCELTYRITNRERYFLSE